MTATRFVTSGPESPLAGVSDDGWRRLITALEIQPMRAISGSGGLGSYDVRPRRLVELGYATDLRYACRVHNRREVQICDFISPWSQKRFLSDPVAQYTVISKSLSLYYRALQANEIQRPKGMSLAGALAVLQIGGRGALESWPNLFNNTRVVYEAAKGAF
jgi:hypothetical protein